MLNVQWKKGVHNFTSSWHINCGFEFLMLNFDVGVVPYESNVGMFSTGDTPWIAASFIELPQLSPLAEPLDAFLYKEPLHRKPTYRGYGYLKSFVYHRKVSRHLLNLKIFINTSSHKQGSRFHSSAAKTCIDCLLCLHQMFNSKIKVHSIYAVLSIVVLYILYFYDSKCTGTCSTTMWLLSGFRQGYSTQHALFRVVEKWKKTSRYDGYSGNNRIHL